jgi:hypothetical protein
MRLLFGGSILLMAAHKVESWFANEWVESPLYQWVIGRGSTLSGSSEDAMGATVFLVFVVWLFIGLALMFMSMWGRRGQLLALSLWGLTFLLEWHHLVRSAMSGHYEPGVVTSVPYLLLMAYYWRELARQIAEPSPRPIGHPDQPPTAQSDRTSPRTSG